MAACLHRNAKVEYQIPPQKNIQGPCVWMRWRSVALYASRYCCQLRGADWWRKERDRNRRPWRTRTEENLIKYICILNPGLRWTHMIDWKQLNWNDNPLATLFVFEPFWLSGVALLSWQHSLSVHNIRSDFSLRQGSSLCDRKIFNEFLRKCLYWANEQIQFCWCSGFPRNFDFWSFRDQS